MPFIKLNFVKNFEYHNSSKFLCILIHGYGSFVPWESNAQNKLKDLKRIIEKADFSLGSTELEGEKNCVDIYFPNLTKEMGPFSTQNPNNIIKEILKDIDNIWKIKKYERIFLIGYSMGALLTRKLYVCACGNISEAPLEKEFNNFQLERQWADKVYRIILLAGINRGWSINHHLSFFKAIRWSIAVGLGNINMFFGKTPLAFHIRRGAPFITQLRIQWIYMRKKASSGEKNCGQALTIQLLGTKDDLVSPEDNIDLVTGKDFVYLEVPFSTHLNVFEMLPDNEKLDKYNKREREERQKVFLSALTDQTTELKAKSQQLTNGAEQLNISYEIPTKNPDEITDVIFVIHGIRDEGHWTNQIAQRVIKKNKEANKKRMNDNQRHFAIETSRYGYFPMLLFALPWTRRAKVAWFMDRYAENLVLYPHAKFSFIGHSNGTYLLAQAIKEYECCKFERVVFAGSVVPKEYNWSKYIDNQRIGRVLNYVATFDWVVAIFPNFLHFFQRDLGSAGHDGFRDRNHQVTNIKYIKGQHGAALDEYNWDAIANFIVEDSPNLSELEELRPPKIFQNKRFNILSIVGRLPWTIWIFIIIGLIFFGYSILFSLSWSQWQKTVVFMIYLWGIWKILTVV